MHESGDTGHVGEIWLVGVRNQKLFNQEVHCLPHNLQACTLAVALVPVKKSVGHKGRDDDVRSASRVVGPACLYIELVAPGAGVASETALRDQPVEECEAASMGRPIPAGILQQGIAR